MLETEGKATGETGDEVLCTKRSDESWEGLLKHVGHSNCNLSESDVEGPEAIVEMATESPEDGGADIEEAGNKSDVRLLNVGRVVGILKNLKSHGRTDQPHESGNNVRQQQKASKSSEKNTKKAPGNTKKLRQTIPQKKKAEKMQKKALKHSKN